MSYKTIKDYIVRRVAKHGYFESKEIFDLEKEGENFDNKCMITMPEVEAEKETLVDRYYCDRTYNVRLAKKISETGGTFEYDAFQMSIDSIIGDVPNPTNFRGDGIRNVIYGGHATDNANSYMVADLIFIAEDSITYA